MLRAGERCGVLFDGDYPRPLFREGKGDAVAARAGEEVDDGVFWGAGEGVRADIFGDFTGNGGQEVNISGRARVTYVATGSGVTPNQASSVRRTS